MEMFWFTLLHIIAKLQLSSTENWVLVWSDEFDGPSINTNLWNFDIGDGCDHLICSWGNNEKQYYTNRTENAFISNGHLIIQARREKLNTFEFTSARMKTKGKGDWKFGKIEIRARFPRGKGILPQIWMLPTYEKYGAWPSSGHVDVAAKQNSNTKQIFATAIYGSMYNEKRILQKTFDFVNQSDFTEEFNVFSLEWSQGKLRWFVNSRNFHEVTSQQVVPNYPFNEKFHLLLSVCVGGNVVGEPVGIRFPLRLEIDYVRVYKRV